MPIVTLLPFIRQQFSDANGNPLSGGLVQTYVAGTTTPQATYTDSTGTVLNTNPVVLDSSGTASIWLIQNAAYKFVIENSSAVVIETIDNVLAPFTSATSLSPQKQIFIATGTFTIPTGVIQTKVTVVGGGGAGGGGTAANSGGGGGAGSAAIKWLSGLTPGLTLAVTVGGGGTGVSGASGNPGALSSVASGTQTIVTVTAGSGGGGTTGAVPGGGAGGTGSNGDVNFGGAGGGTGQSAINVGGGGASSIFGGGGSAGGPNTAGTAALAAGAGGGGAGGSVGNTAGGAGLAGIVIFEWVA